MHVKQHAALIVKLSHNHISVLRSLFVNDGALRDRPVI
jgi:hypothetical protein